MHNFSANKYDGIMSLHTLEITTAEGIGDGERKE
jgi:hypothetical protein